MCADAIEARGEEGVWLLVEAVYQSVGGRRLRHYGMQFGSEYMVHE